jgi:hypothetical protein
MKNGPTARGGLTLGPRSAPPYGRAATLRYRDHARNPDLHIVSTLATAELSGKNLSPVQIGAMTHAHYLVDGSAERRGDRLQLHVQLIDSGDSRIVRSGRFEPTAQDLPDVTEALISWISASLGATVRESDRAVLRNRASASPTTIRELGGKAALFRAGLRECAAFCPRMHGSNTSDGLLQGGLAVVTDSYRPCRRGGGGVARFGCGRTLFADVSDDAAEYADGSIG